MLYIVGTPIGNLGDMSARAQEVLAEAEVIACEDTRRTGLLLSNFGIKKKLISYHEHNKAQRKVELLALLREGKCLALVSDAGMPCISDPGEDLVRACREENLPVSVVPGPVAAVSALAVSGFPSQHFYFEGFLPASGKERKERLAELVLLPCTCILYEAPHRLLRTLVDMEKSGMGERCAALCRELTKKFEEVIILTVAEAAAYYRETEPRGEYVVVMEGSGRLLSADSSEGEPDESEKRRQIGELLNAGKSTKDAAAQLAAAWGLPRKDVYEMVLAEKGRL